MRFLITGIGGFVGHHLARYVLQEPGAEVFGLLRGDKLPESFEREFSDQVTVVRCDLMDGEAVARAVADVQPEAIFHLAARSSVAESLADPVGTITNNVVGQINLLEAAVRLGTRPRILVVGSDEEYGQVRPGELPIREDAELRPVTPYGVSKVAQDLLGFQYFVAHGLPVVRVRPFNTIGPGQDARFVASSFAWQIARVEAGLQEPAVHVGNLDVRRDITDVRDMVSAMYLALAKGEPGQVYNLCSGRSVRIGQLLEILLSLSDVPIRVEQDPARVRAVDIPEHVGDSTRFRRLTGWHPKVQLEQTLRDILDYWRRTLARG